MSYPRPSSCFKGLSSFKGLAAPILALTAAFGLCACASAPPAAPGDVASTVTQAPPEDRSPFGLFLAGEAALDNDANQDAAQYFARADREDQDALIRQKAFLAAVAAGDVDKAAALAAGVGGDVSGGVPRLGRLVQAVSDLAGGRGKDAYAILSKDAGGFAYVDGYQLLKPWAALAAGDGAHAVMLPDTQGQKLNRMAAVLSRSLIDERLHRFDEAEAGYKTLTANAQLGVFYVLSYGAYLERRARADDAEALYKKYLAKIPEDRDLQSALTRVMERRPAPPMPTIAAGAGRALTSAAELALVQRSVEEGEIYLRLGLKLDPTNDEAWLLLGDVEAAADRYPQARDDYARVSPASTTAIEARERIITSYENAGDHDTALTLARELAKAAPEDRGALLILAETLRGKEQYEESAQVLAHVMDADPADEDWTLYFLRGTALSEAGHWAEGERDLLKALSLQPDQPDVLNYLGYTWVEKNERLEQAMAMLQKASTAEPESGEIADSLGWAYYHLGDYHSAVLNLERAVSFNAVSPEINDHLGDAYWQVGRKTEAQYQWRRVLSLQPAPELKAATEKKLSLGLDMPVAPPSVARG